jgi:hypothetical protein
MGCVANIAANAAKNKYSVGTLVPTNSVAIR